VCLRAGLQAVDKKSLTLSRIEHRIPCVNTFSHPSAKSLCYLSYRCLCFYQQDNINVNAFMALFSILNVILPQSLCRHNYRPAAISSCTSLCKLQSRCSSVKSCFFFLPLADWPRYVPRIAFHYFMCIRSKCLFQHLIGVCARAHSHTLAHFLRCCW